MSKHTTDEGIIRRLWPTETDKLRDHLLRLDEGSRRLRFAHSVSDAFIDDYASRMGELGSLVYGHIVDGKVRVPPSCAASVTPGARKPRPPSRWRKPIRTRALAPS